MIDQIYMRLVYVIQYVIAISIQCLIELFNYITNLINDKLVLIYLTKIIKGSNILNDLNNLIKCILII